MTDKKQPETIEDLQEIFDELEQPTDLRGMARRVQLWQKILDLNLLSREEHPQLWAGLQNALGNALQQNPLGNRANNVEQAIFAYENALTIYTREKFPEEWAGTLNNLAVAYASRIRGDREDNIERAILSHEQVLEIYTRELFPKDWAEAKNNLATAYRIRIRGNRVDNIERSIIIYEQTLEIYTYESFPEEWAGIQNNLAIAYANRIRGDRADNIDRAIANYKMALEIYTYDAFPEDWAMTQNNLALAYRNRILGSHADNIEQAIAAYKQSLRVRSREALPEDWASTQNNLALAYADRITGDRARNIEQAIIAYECSLEVCTRDAFPEDWAMTQNNLANAYADRIKGNQSQNIEQAITAYKQALEVRTRTKFSEDWAVTQYNLAAAYLVRIEGNHADNIQQAIISASQALEIHNVHTHPNNCRLLARLLAKLYSVQCCWQAAASAYQKALQAADILYQDAVLLGSKAAELKSNENLSHQAAYALARISNLQTAIETLEQSRARGLSESLDRDRTNLNHLKKQNPTLHQQYKEITQQLRNLETQQRDRMVSSDRHSVTPETLRNTATSLREQLTTTIDQIRQQPGYETFLRLPNFADVQYATSRDCPLVYVITTPAGSLALIVTPNTIESVWLDNFAEVQLTELLQSWFAAYNQSQGDRQAWYDEIASVTRQLWEPVMQPIIQHLKDHQFRQATLIPTGYLSLFPLHAAWTEDPSTPTGKRYALDDIHFTYAPNARSLTAAAAIANQVHIEAMLAIDNPRNDLLNSEREVNAAIASFPQHTVLRHSAATIEAVKSSLSKVAIAHFSCHGTADLTEPLNSGLLMSDGLLTLKDIFALNLSDTTQGNSGIRLAILSACETGLQGLENADEAVSLPTGLLQAGVAAVIASLWSIDDLSTMLLLTRFYDLWRIEGREIDQAFRQAQQWVRDTTNTQKYDYLKDAMQKLVDAQLVSPQESNNVLREFMLHYIYIDGPQGQSFAHHFHWAAFTYIGV